MVAGSGGDPHDRFPVGFFSRADEGDDAGFYAADRFVTHIDDRAIAAVGAVYGELGATGVVLDLCSSWISHLLAAPARLVVLGMNRAELAANPMADERVVQDLNADPALPFPDATFDAVTCTVSIDYLVRPVEVLTEVARVLVAGGWVAMTYSNRCFPTKAIRGWLATSDEDHGDLVATYLRLVGGFTEPSISLRTPLTGRGDPLWAVWAHRNGRATDV